MTQFSNYSNAELRNYLKTAEKVRPLLEVGREQLLELNRIDAVRQELISRVD